MQRKKLFVGGINFRATLEEFREHFGPAGEIVDIVIMKDRETGRSRGFGFVEYATPEEAARAIEQFDGKEFLGRVLKVNEAQPRERDGFAPRRDFAPRNDFAPRQDAPRDDFAAPRADDNFGSDDDME